MFIKIIRGSALVDMLELEAKRLNFLEIITEASITAKSFFKHKGYHVICSQIIERKGIKLTNYRMAKKIIAYFRSTTSYILYKGIHILQPKFIPK
ncbi:TPA: GNAT family N-acetyltransferase [Bacillus tropicus]